MRVTGLAWQCTLPQESRRPGHHIQCENIHDAGCVDQVVVGLPSPAIVDGMRATTAPGQLGVNGRMGEQPFWFKSLRITDLYRVPVGVNDNLGFIISFDVSRSENSWCLPHLLGGRVFCLSSSRVGVAIDREVHTAAWLHADAEIVRFRILTRIVYDLLSNAVRL